MESCYARRTGPGEQYESRDDGQVAHVSPIENDHHEAALFVAIGGRGKSPAATDGARLICVLCATPRHDPCDLQRECKKQGRPWEIGKAVDASAPMGPITPIAKPGEITSGAITLTVNGKTTQSSDIAKLIWNVNEVIEHLSAAWELQPGDLIMTDTPEGVAAVVASDVMVASCAGVEPISVKVV